MNIDYFLNLPVKTQLAMGSCLAVIACVIIGVFLAYRKLEFMEGLLDNCRLVAAHRRFWANSLRGRMIRLCVVHVAIALPGWNARRGAIDLRQVQAFPRGLKAIFSGMSFFGITGVTGWIAVYFSDHLNL
ncbi:hypothetical protein P0D91_17955 [Pseudomonas sp. CBSPBW29]|uniref:hypothetical protein n=1 Tax=Pseudomonas TaxID=286 RepID=UPI0021AC0476|nr:MULTISPECIES: hypothetical protein [unclassified Pseudomonas]WEL40208.1 hypothetical protein P0D91_17955 [Pseudomonas sp. CBSPBW29]WEL66952.1 hypothetical protein P0D93_12110 [Pseudomonas sp. CBSPGW29]WEL70452.1 hypothetical protein P0D94_31410 [Pseudomonas sp. CBSPCGW29]WEL83998.1 hypothetical protein P0D95_08330 [Pseudomonas sp. CBSPCAW29]WEL86835.1 hypothetical protein P0D90_24040 [Pseudomonas sp. CBSPCBW29]